PGGNRRRLVLRHADLRAGAHRAGADQRDSPRGRGKRPQQPPHLPRLARACAQAPGGRVAAGRVGTRSCRARGRAAGGRRPARAEPPRRGRVMKRFLLLSALAVGLVGGVGSAAADDVVGFTVAAPQSAAPAGLPSALVPNGPGSISVPVSFQSPPPLTQQLPLTALGELWRSAGAAYGVPWQVLAAINKIESNFGQNMGPSSAGAIGWMQFMPDTWLRWGVDANGDGIADPWNAADAIVAAARYLAAVSTLSAQLAAQRQAALYDAHVVLAGRRLSHAQSALAAAQKKLAAAQQSAQAPSFAPGASSLLAGPTYTNGYVFPVGGGPS